MAATNYTPISLYYSTTASAVPTTGNLVNGELGLNIADMKLYAKNSAGTVTLLASNASTGATVSSVAMTVPSFLTVSGSPITSSGTLAVTLSGTALPVANGGTGQTTYTDGQLLIGNSTGNTLAKTTLTAGSGVTITNGSGTITIAASGSGGTVTSVAQSFTGGLISVSGSPVTTTGTLALTVAGTSGGIPYFSSSSTWATSAALTQYGIVYGGGAGATPVATAAGTTGQVLTATTGGAPSWTTPSSVSLSANNTWTGTQSFVGTSSVLAEVLTNAAEVITISATATTGSINYDVTTQSVLYYTSNATGNWLLNFRGSSGTSLNTIMSTGQCMTVVFLATQGSTAYYQNATQIDGTTSGVTVKWQGGTTPSSGNASGIDVYAFTIIKTASATWTVLGSQTQFK